MMFNKSRTIRYVETILDELANQSDALFLEHCKSHIRSILKSITAGLVQNEETLAHQHTLTICDRLQNLYNKEPSFRTHLHNALLPDTSAIQQLESSSLGTVLRTKLFCDHVVVITDEEAARECDESTRMAM